MAEGPLPQRPVKSPVHVGVAEMVLEDLEKIPVFQKTEHV